MVNLQNQLQNEPSQSSWRWLIWKSIIWFIIWWILAILIFIILSFVWGIFSSSISPNWTFNNTSPILSLIILLIWFLSSFIWNLSIAWIYSLFFSERYFKTAKTIWILLLTNWIIFIFLAPIYLSYWSDTKTLFTVLWLHIIFSAFISSQQIENTSNPNYWASALIWNTLWFVVAILIYILIEKSSTITGAQNETYIKLLVPPIVWFAIMPLWLWIREKIYHKMYEMWNDWFYTAPTSQEKQEIIKNNEFDENEEDEINIDLQ